MQLGNGPPGTLPKGQSGLEEGLKGGNGSQAPQNKTLFSQLGGFKFSLAQRQEVHMEKSATQ